MLGQKLLIWTGLPPKRIWIISGKLLWSKYHPQRVKENGKLVRITLLKGNHLELWTMNRKARLLCKPLQKALFFTTKILRVKFKVPFLVVILLDGLKLDILA
uniref:Uncharacterized protein LOC8288911 n=1 Tax=Rhizophora mucronata TaxID=61149 RepID=A0A2P2MVR4_RHIMU